MMEPLGFWIKGLEQSDLKVETAGSNEGKAQTSQESYQAKRHAFSDEDLNKLLIKLGYKPSSTLREMAKFLLTHRFELNQELLEKVKLLMPEGPYQGQKAEALVAVLSKISGASIERGYQILLSTLNSDHSTVMGSIKHFISLLSDVLSETRLFQGQAIKAEWIQKAFSEELEQWKSWVTKPEQQLFALLDRHTLSQDLRRFIHLSQWASKMLEALEQKNSEGLRRRLAKVQKAAGHAADVMLADGILSRPEEIRHMRDHGLCFSLGLEWEDEMLPCRMWVFDDQHTENLALDSKNVRLFFRMMSQKLGLLEVEIRIQSENMTLRFSSELEEVRQLFDKESYKLEEHLIKLGYQTKVKPTRAFLRHNDPEIEIESRTQSEMVHMDVKV